VKRLIVAGLGAVAAAAVVAGVVLLGAGREREREWAHGGDRLAVGVEVALADRATFESVAVRLGVPPGQATRPPGADQFVVVRIRWAGPSPLDGSMAVMLLDKRVTPPRPLAAEAGWIANGGTGSTWGSSYEVLARKYDWLRGISAADLPIASVAAPAPSGTVTAWFRQWGAGSVPFADPAAEVLVALAHQDEDGEFRWARRIYG
jgi:hypothetical protein